MSSKGSIDMSRAETAELFRERLLELIARAQISRSAFAARVGMDRSTLSQILSPGSDRLPRVETLATIALSEGVSLDWLVGLSQEGSLATKVLPGLEITRGQAPPADERLESWHAEAIGYKIRHVPTSLPDVLKTDAVIEYEYRQAVIASPEQRFETRKRSLIYQRRSETDTEVCNSMQVLRGFVRGEGIWSDLDEHARAEQVELWKQLVDELYPTFRWFLYDARERYSVPLTLFGPNRAVIYVGQGYFVFNSTEQIRALTTHFDDLIRAARVLPTQVADFLESL